ncbi:MAG: hypothetical protein HKN13_04570 [Rhodothermales bacterium]|nr:hypothetical protein [Rhodothermales bacterium]
MSDTFKLIETMRCDGGIEHLARHMHRLSRSAEYFGIRLDSAAIQLLVSEKCASIPPDSTPRRVRLVLGADGCAEMTVKPLAPPVPAPRWVSISESVIDESDIFRRHKTTRRELYDVEYEEALSNGLFEVVYMNRSGRLAEGSRTNVFVERRGEWLTPPVEDGALPGILLSVVLETNEMAHEDHVTTTTLLAADRVLVCNAVIGLVEVQLTDSTTGHTGDALYG